MLSQKALLASPSEPPAAQDSEPATAETCDLIGLIAAIALKQEGAMTYLYTHTAPRIYRIAYSVLASEQDAEEIVCDILMYVWENAPRYDRARGSVMGWLTAMTRNRAIDRIRKRRRHVSIDQTFDYREAPLTAEDGPDAALTRYEDHRGVCSAMAALSPLRRQLVGLSFFQELSHGDIADALAMPQGTVKSHMRRGLIAMRETLTVQQRHGGTQEADAPSLECRDPTR